MSDLLLPGLVSWLSGLSFLVGGFFFIAGTLGLLRFPDVYSRLHAVTKADTLGFGFIVLGLSMRADSVQSVTMMVLIWLLVLASGATACQLLAHYAQASSEEDSHGAD